MEIQYCVNKDCKLFEHCRPDLNGVPPCANIEEPAQQADNTTQAAIALLRRWIIPTTDDQDDMSTLQAETESFIAQHAAVR